MFNQCLHALYFCNPEICIHHHRIMKRKSLLKAIQIKSCPLFSPSFSFSLLFFLLSLTTQFLVVVDKLRSSKEKTQKKKFFLAFSIVIFLSCWRWQMETVEFTPSHYHRFSFSHLFTLFFSRERELRKSFADLSSG